MSELDKLITEIRNPNGPHEALTNLDRALDALELAIEQRNHLGHMHECATFGKLEAGYDDEIAKRLRGEG